MQVYATQALILYCGIATASANSATAEACLTKLDVASKHLQHASYGHCQACTGAVTQPLCNLLPSFLNSALAGDHDALLYGKRVHNVV